MSSPYQIVLSGEEESVLAARARSVRGPYRDRLLAAIVLAAAVGQANAAIGRQLGCAQIRSASGAAGSLRAGWPG